VKAGLFSSRKITLKRIVCAIIHRTRIIMSNDGIVIKGSREGLLVTLGPGAWHNALGALEARLNASPEFFKGARVGLIVGPRKLTEIDVRAARDLLTRFDVTLWSLISEDEDSRQVASRLGLDATLPKREPPPRAAEPTTDLGPTDDPDLGLVVRRTLRSGQSLRHPGSIAVIGDVNPGAEIIAGGDIIVWGRLRGTVHAGAMGNVEAIVCALDLSPTQLRIAQHIARSPDERRRRPMPEVARVRDGHIVAEAWEAR
jgi:septum site-determining protein MinC